MYTAPQAVLSARVTLLSVMAGLGPAIHDFFVPAVQSWMPGSSRPGDEFVGDADAYSAASTLG